MKTKTTDCNGNPIISRGSYRAEKPAAQIDWQLAKGPKGFLFSASGSLRGNGCGQVIDQIAAAHPNDARIQEIAAVWRVYHLNDMQPGTAEQMRLGWGKQELTLVSYSAPVFTPRKVYPSQAALMSNLKGWVTTNAGLSTSRGQSYFGKVYIGGHSGVGNWDEYQAVIRALWSSFVEHPKNPDSAAVLWFANTFDCQRKESKKLSGWVTPAEHPEGVLGKPCPITGKGYGSEWYYLPIPAEVVATVQSWDDNAGGLSFHDRQALDFLAAHGIKCRANLADKQKAPAWADEGGVHGQHFRVTLSKKRARLVFDYWGSQKDAETGKHPSAYDVLACISSEANTPDTFADFCREYGYESDSIKALATFKRANTFARRLRAFFTAGELEGLAEIQ